MNSINKRAKTYAFKDRRTVFSSLPLKPDRGGDIWSCLTRNRVKLLLQWLGELYKHTLWPCLVPDEKYFATL